MAEATARRTVAKKAAAPRKTTAKKTAPRKAEAPRVPAKRGADRAAKDAAAVEALMATLDHPFKAEVEALRKVIRAAGPKLQERVKWNAPSWHLEGDDLGAFDLWQRDFVQLVLLFRHGVVDDPTGLLEGEWKDRRTARFDGMADVRKKKAALAKIVRGWTALAEGSR